MEVSQSEVKEAQKEIAERDATVERLWEAGSLEYNGVQIKIADSYRRAVGQRTEEQNKARLGLLLLRLDQSRPLLDIFPGLKVVLEETTYDYEIVGVKRTSVPEFLYETETRTLYMTSKGMPSEGVFTHEMGHHVHGFFGSKQHEEFLKKQNWKVKENGEREATVKDLLKRVNETVAEGQETPDWILRDGEGNPGKRYRHSNPCEMIAETVADNQESLYEFINKNSLSGQEAKGEVFDFILSRLRSF